MAAVAMETAKMLKTEKHKNDHSRLLAKQKLMNLDRNNNHISWNKISQKISESVGQISLFLCQVPKGSAVWSEFKIVYLGYHGNILHFDFFNPSKAA
jgi:hypothetical protein